MAITDPQTRKETIFMVIKLCQIYSIQQGNIWPPILETFSHRLQVYVIFLPVLLSTCDLIYVVFMYIF
jgi:hypothetical protein